MINNSADAIILLCVLLPCVLFSVLLLTFLVTSSHKTTPHIRLIASIAEGGSVTFKRKETTDS